MEDVLLVLDQGAVDVEGDDLVGAEWEGRRCGGWHSDWCI